MQKVIHPSIVQDGRSGLFLVCCSFWVYIIYSLEDSEGRSNLHANDPRDKDCFVG